MTIQTINIGVEGNDGTGDSIRGAFTKVNENFDFVAKATGLEGGLRLTDLSDGPLIDPITNLPYKADQIMMINSNGDRLIARSITTDGTVVARIVDGALKLSVPSTKLSADLLPYLSRPLNAANLPIGKLPYPNQSAVDVYNATWQNIPGAGGPTTLNDLPVTVGYAAETFLGVYNGALGFKQLDGSILTPELSSQPTQIDTTSAFYDASLTGNYLSNALVPRKDLVYRGGDTMSGPLYLSNHPTPLNAVVTDDVTDLQAATKLYVDNKTFSSSVNLYVSASSGNDLQTNTPNGKEGRFWNYAYNTVGAALLHAQSLIELASQEPGPYKQRISWTNGADLHFSTIQKVTLTSGKSDTEGYIAAYDLLQANRSFIQAETIAYINKKYVNKYSFVESELKIKIGNLISAVSDDLMLGAVDSQGSTPALTYNSYWFAVEYLRNHPSSDELIQWNSIIDFVKLQFTDFSYNVPNLRNYTAAIVNALCYDFLVSSNYQSLQTGLSFTTANTGISASQLESMLVVNPITIKSANFSGDTLTLYFDEQPTNILPIGSQILVNAVLTRSTSTKSLSNFVGIVTGPIDLTKSTLQIEVDVSGVGFTTSGAYTDRKSVV